jgi:6-phosphogluconolactonase
LVPTENIHEFPSAEIGTLEQAAEKFDAVLEPFWGDSLPRFDLILLGVGPDGHVASLFPGHQEQIPNRFTVIESNSPKPPAKRLSLSLEILNNADEVWFTVAGRDKADAVAAAMSGDSQLPVALVKAKANRWFIDEAAAAGI